MVAQNAPGMLDVYVEGVTNAQNNIAYPFKITGNVCTRIPRSTKITAKAKGHITISASGIKGGVGMQVVPGDPKKFAKEIQKGETSSEGTGSSVGTAGTSPTSSSGYDTHMDIQ